MRRYIATFICAAIIAFGTGFYVKAQNSGSFPAGGGGMPLAGSNLTWYVATTGNDNNPGTSGSPFKTIQHAATLAASYDWQGLYAPTINVAAGTYNEEIKLVTLVNCVTGGTITGDTTTPDNVVVDDLGVDASFRLRGGALWTITGFKIAGTNSAFYVSSFSTLTFDKINFAGVFTQAAIAVEAYATAVGAGGTLTISSSMQSFAFTRGNLIFSGSTITISTAISTTDDFIGADSTGGFVGLAGTSFVNGSNLTATSGGIQGSNGAFVETQAATVDSAPLTRGNFPGGWFRPGFDNTSVFQADLTQTIDVPTTGGTVTMFGGQKHEIINPAGTLAALTVVLPIDMSDGSVTSISSTHIITSLTVSASDGSTIVAAPTSLAAGQTFSMIFDLGTTSWYPM